MKCDHKEGVPRMKLLIINGFTLAIQNVYPPCMLKVKCWMESQEGKKKPFTTEWKRLKQQNTRNA